MLGPRPPASADFGGIEGGLEATPSPGPVYDTG